MNLSQLVDQTLFFVSQQAGTTAPRVAAAFIGLLGAMFLVTALWDRKIRAVLGVFGLVLCLLLIGMALDTRVLHALAATDYLVRVRILMGLVSLAVLVVTVESIRRSHLQERYALLWVATGLLILVTAFFPQILDLLGFLFGTRYATSVVGILFVFLLLIAFHFSLALSAYQQKQTRIAQRCAMLEARLEELTRHVVQLRSDKPDKAANPFRPASEPASCVSLSPSPKPAPKPARYFRGTQVAVPLIISCAALAVLLVGLLVPQAMIGDEVTHFFMLVRQSLVFPEPNFFAHIPTGWGDVEIRRYPHAFWWHYLGAFFYKISGGSFAVVQIYQTAFWVQFLGAGYLLAKSRGGVQSRSAILYLLVLASLPMGLIFSVALYQDVPMAAQVLTAFYLLSRGRWVWASAFMALALGFKITGVLFIPPFLFLLWYWEKGSGSKLRTAWALLLCAVIIGSAAWNTAWSLRNYAESGYYPMEQVQGLVKTIKQRAMGSSDRPARGPAGQAEGIDRVQASSPEASRVTAYEKEIIANHPGDLRIPVNFIVYGGVLLWLALVVGLAGYAWPRRNLSEHRAGGHSPWWLFGVGCWYLMLAAVLLRTAPDARFFLPGLPFVLLPFCEAAVRLPKSKVLISLFAALAVLQGGLVLTKTYELRDISPELRESIHFLEKRPPEPRLVFMYPEGNYRLFPVRHEWYMGYGLRDFWWANNDVRIAMLQGFGIGAVVVKKHLVADVDAAITNLGVYPTYFVRDLHNDPRFVKVFENQGVVIFRVPEPEGSIHEPGASLDGQGADLFE